MKIKTLSLLITICLFSFSACSQQEQVPEQGAEVKTDQKEQKQVEPHRYGGWYCPDNLNGFPAVDLAQWEDVPVVNGRMATREETQNGSSLIHVDLEKYPDAKPLDMTMPRLAHYYNRHTKRDELVIVIQAIIVSGDSIVGFRYLNGGNGSAWLHDVDFLTSNEIAMMAPTHFVTYDITINAKPHAIWDVLTGKTHTAELKQIFDANDELASDWRNKSNMNFNYLNAGNVSSSYDGILYGNYYIQNDYDHLLYNEKFLLLEDGATNTTTLKIVCGPFGEDFEVQKTILHNWAEKVRELSEKG